MVLAAQLQRTLLNDNGLLLIGAELVDILITGVPSNKSSSSFDSCLSVEDESIFNLTMLYY